MEKKENLAKGLNLGPFGLGGGNIFLVGHCFVIMFNLVPHLICCTCLMFVDLEKGVFGKFGLNKFPK
jgi:hypothetical protein